MFENGKIYDRKSSVTWPDGTTQTAEELKSSAEWRDMFERPYVLCENEKGVTTHFFELDGAKDTFGIIEPDPEKALAAIKAAEVEAQKRAKRDLELYASSMDTTQQATAELGVMQATSMESVAELGGTVAALEARIAALESGAKA